MTDITTCADYPALQQLARALWHAGGGRGAAVLVGAGLSRTARVAGGDLALPPLWTDLAKVMAERLYPGEIRRAPTDSLRLAEEFRTYFGQAALDELLRSMINDGAWSPSQIHRMLLSLPWSDVLTTNYDTLLERAARLVDREYQPVISEADLAHAKAPRIVKLHGSMGASEHLVIAEEDYRNYPVRHAAFVNLARQVFVENELVLIGFSGDDPNFTAWAGWVRDHLGSSARRIYLGGALNLGPAKRKFLEARNIAPIDLHELVRDLDASVRHEAAVEMLLAHLSAAAPVPPHKWTPALTSRVEPSLDRDAGREADRLQRVAESWRADRSSYPGWLICPSELRQTFRHSVEEAPFRESVLIGMEPRDAALATVELCWRHRVALWPLHPAMVPLVERFGMVEDDNLPVDDRLIVACTLARQFRFEGDRELFERIAESVLRISPAPSDAAAEMAYMRAQRACLEMSFDKAIQFASGIVGDDPFWGVRRAAILSEAGLQAEAEAMVRDAVAELRDRQRTDRDSIWIGSRLAWAEMMGRAFAQSRLEFPPWTDRFQANRSDPFVEVSHLRDRVAERQRSEPSSGRTPAFSPGSYTDHSRTIHFKSWSNLEPAVELDLMLSDGGVPPRLEHVSLFTAERLDALRLVEDDTLDWHLHLIRLLDASDKSFGRYWSRLRVARLPADVLIDLVKSVEEAVTYWTSRVSERKEPFLLADNRMRLSLRALARLAIRLQPDKADDVYRQALELLGRFPGRFQSDALGELIRNAWSAIPPERRPQLVPDTLDLPLTAHYTGVEPMEWLFDTSVELACKDPRRATWVHRWTEAAKNEEELRPSAILRLLYLRGECSLEANEEVAFEEAVWVHRDKGEPSMPEGTSVRTAFWANVGRPDGLVPADAVRTRLFASAGELTDHDLTDIRGAIETGRVLPNREQAADLFDRLCAEDPPQIGDDALAGLRANFAGYDRRYRQRLVSVVLAVVGSILDTNDLSPVRREALQAFVSRSDAIAAISALTRWPVSPGALLEIASAVRRGLRSSDSDDVSDAIDVLLRWEDSLVGFQPPEEVLGLVEAVVSAIEYRRSHAVWHLLRAAGRLVGARLTSQEQNDRLATALGELFQEWDYENVKMDSEEAGVVSLVRVECARLADALKREGFTSAGSDLWTTEAAIDPLPEVRFAVEEP